MRNDLNIFDFFAQIPWWIYVSSSVICYIILQYVIPYTHAQYSMVNEVKISLGPVLAPIVAVALLSPVTFTFLKSNRKWKLHDLRTEIKLIQDLPWPQLKDLVAEAYRRAGYLILAESPYASDPDIDLVMRKSANLYLLQARYWLNRKVGLREVKKLYSLTHEKQASGAFILTTGIFTREALRFAAGRSITLVDGIKLVELFAPVRNSEPHRNTLQ